MSKLAEQKIKEFYEKFAYIYYHAGTKFSVKETSRKVFESWLSITFQEIEQARDEEIIEKINGEKKVYRDYWSATEFTLKEIPGEYNQALDDAISIIKSLSKQ